MEVEELDQRYRSSLAIFSEIIAENIRSESPAIGFTVREHLKDVLVSRYSRGNRINVQDAWTSLFCEIRQYFSNDIKREWAKPENHELVRRNVLNRWSAQNFSDHRPLALAIYYWAHIALAEELPDVLSKIDNVLLGRPFRTIYGQNVPKDDNEAVALREIRSARSLGTDGYTQHSKTETSTLVTGPSAPFEWPPYVSQADAKAADVDDPIWLNPHNHFSIPLEGREAEMRTLNAFVNAPERFLICALIAPSGAGKTRLVSEWLRGYVATASQREWDAGFVRSVEPSPWSDWEATHNSIIVVDYTYSYKEVLQKIAERCRFLPERGPKIRLLVIDHVYPEILHSDPFWQVFFRDQRDLEGERSKFIFKNSPVELKPEGKDSALLKNVICAAAKFCSKKQLETADETVVRAEKHLHHIAEKSSNSSAALHPLFAALIGQAIGAGSDFSEWSRRDLLSQYFSKAERLPWLSDELIRRQGQGFGKWIGVVVSIAILFRGTSKQSLRRSLRPHLRSKIAIDNVLAFADRLVSGEQREQLAPLEPDILGEIFLLHFLECALDDPEFFGDFIAVADFVNREGDISKGSRSFFDVVARLSKNLSHEDQNDPEVRSSWVTLAEFLDVRSYSDTPWLQDAVAVVLTNKVAKLGGRSIPGPLCNQLTQVDSAILARALQGLFWREAFESLMSRFRETSVLAENCDEILQIMAALRTSDDRPELVEDVCFTPLTVAAREGHLELVKALVSIGYDPNQPYGCAYSRAIESAAYSGRKEVVSFFLANGVPLDNPYMENPLCSDILSNAAYSDDAEFFEWMTSQGAAMCSLPFDDEMALEYAISSPGFDTTPPYFSHPLIISCQRDHLDIFKFCFDGTISFGLQIELPVYIQEGQKSLTTFKAFDNLLQYAAACGSHEILRFLMGKFPLRKHAELHKQAAQAAHSTGRHHIFSLAQGQSACLETGKANQV